MTQLGGHVDHFVGDAVMALFGTPQAHEDDAVRAVRAAREIHRRAAGITMADASGRQAPLQMHSGIATGLVVVSRTDAEGIGDIVLGDTVNVASRLTELAKPGEIVVGEATHALTCGQFDFDPLGSLHVRGREAPVQAFRFSRPKRDPETLHRLTGLCAEFVGREQELARLDSAAKALLRGSSTFVGVAGAAGTGKSRLVTEFRAGEIGRQFIWREAHCCEYAANVPYSAVLDLLGRAWDIDQADTRAHVHAKIHDSLQRVVGEDGVTAARIERLWGIENPLLDGVDPESWRTQVYKDLARVFDAITFLSPTVLLVEDFQWADDASLELLHYVLGRIRAPVIVLGTYRPPFGASDIGGEGWRRDQIVLDDLSPDETVALACSLLGAEELPPDLERFLRLELGGNPFHVEESMNALVDTGVLVPEGERWRLAKPLAGMGAPLTVAASVDARVDLLGPESKRMIQAAAVMGRVFSADMLERVAPQDRDVVEALVGIERLGLVIPVGDPQDRVFAFKHALTQDAIAQGLLHEERCALHELTARAYVDLYADRLPEFYETIAFHFERGQVGREAVRYLIGAGEKSLKRYAVSQASRYFGRAYELTMEDPALANDPTLLADLLVRWAHVEYYLGNFLKLESLLLLHYDSLESVTPELRASYEVWLGTVFWHRQRLSRAREHLERGRALAEESADTALVALAEAELAYTHADLGELVVAVACAERACAAARLLDADAFLWEEAFGGAGYTHWCTGRVVEARSAGENCWPTAQRTRTYGVPPSGTG